ncbi:MAG: polyprenyl synthetase family protein [Coleofasciculus sp. C1-SOL-03]|jgi:geranylgeranyl diphosphate synthase type I|uniref:polyprenyl synthetase family protein n=1 Tax=Coleofasciculus sp. C1-SOL-03 TaxID=3069522 RepID=UPI0032F4D855
MDSLKELYPEVREVLKNSIPNYWSELRYVLKGFLEGAMSPEAMLPLASCQAVNGNPKNAIHISAALLAFGACLRILDDLEDRDRADKLWEKVGTARAWNFACAVNIICFEILSKAPLQLEVFKSINQCYLDTCLRIAAGQDKDLAGVTQTIDDYWLSIQMKTASASAMACATGAMVGTDNSELIQACGVFGHHLGLAIQILNDMESIWQPDGITDLKQGKITLPLLYGLQSNHPEREELMSIVSDNEIATHAERIQEILDHIDTKRFLIWAALKEREQALEAIKICPNAEGREVLESYITGMFGDIDLLLEKPEDDKT